MLIRADPQTKTISLLSFPRDLIVPIYCGSTARTPSGTSSRPTGSTPPTRSAARRAPSLTVKHLTGLPINYLITVNFHGFKEVVDKLGGVWIDVDRRYYNTNTARPRRLRERSTCSRATSGWTAGTALDFVRFRHTDSDFYRLARQQEFVRAFKEQVAHNFSLHELPSLVNTITHNVEVGEGGRALQGEDGDLVRALRVVAAARPLLPGQDRERRSARTTCTASSDDIQAAVDQFQNPDVGSSKAANAVALGKKVKPKTPPPSTVTRDRAERQRRARAPRRTRRYLLAQRGYRDR